MYSVYVIKNDCDEIYIGHTENITKRLQRHNCELPTKKTSYSFKRKKGVWKLIYEERFNDRSDAKRREKELKSYQGRQFIRRLNLQLVDPPVGGL